MAVTSTIVSCICSLQTRPPPLSPWACPDQLLPGTSTWRAAPPLSSSGATGRRVQNKAASFRQCRLLRPRVTLNVGGVRFQVSQQIESKWMKIIGDKMSKFDIDLSY